MNPTWIEVEPNRFINIDAAIEIERDPEDPSIVMVTLPACGYEPAAPLLVALTGETADLVLAHVRAVATGSMAALRQRYGALVVAAR